MRVCKFEGCDGKHHARGWCNKHDHRIRRHGDPRQTTRYTEDVVELVRNGFSETGSCAKTAAVTGLRPRAVREMVERYCEPLRGPRMTRAQVTKTASDAYSAAASRRREELALPVVGAYRRTYSVKKVAKEFYVSWPQIRRILDEYDPDLRMNKERRRVAKAHKYRQAMDLWKSGMSQAAAARRVGISPSILGRWIKRGSRW